MIRLWIKLCFKQTIIVKQFFDYINVYFFVDGMVYDYFADKGKGYFQYPAQCKVRRGLFS